MRRVACITQPSVIDQVLSHLRARGDGRRGRRAESPRDLRTVRTGRHATTRRGPPDSLRLTLTPRSRAGTFGVRVIRSVSAATGRPRETTSGRPPRRGGGRRAGCCAPARPRVVGDRAVCSPNTRPSPIDRRMLVEILDLTRECRLNVIREREHVRDIAVSRFVSLVLCRCRHL